MKKFLAVLIALALLTTMAFADVNSGKVTKKGGLGVYLDYAPWSVEQTQSPASAKPEASAVTRLSVIYGAMDNLEVGLTRIDDTAVAPAEHAAYFYTNHGYILSAAYGLNDLLGNWAFGTDIKGKFEYSLPRLSSFHINGLKPEDDPWIEGSGTYLGIQASKEMFVKGLTIAGSLGVRNFWSVDKTSEDSPIYDFMSFNKKGSSALEISAGVDYMLQESLTCYLTISHTDNSSLIGQEDGTYFFDPADFTGALIPNKPRNDKSDSIIIGIRYDI